MSSVLSLILLNILSLNAGNIDNKNQNPDMDKFISQAVTDQIKFDPVLFDQLLKQLEEESKKDESKKSNK